MIELTSVSQPAAYVPVLAALHREAFAVPWSEKAFASAIAAPGTAVIMATQDQAENAVGFILFRQVLDEAEILTLMVRPEIHRQGCGKSLLEAAVTCLQSRGVRRLFLDVDITNHAAKSLYQHAHFNVIGRRRGYFKTPSGGRSDALVMQRLIIASDPEHRSLKTVDGSHMM